MVYILHAALFFTFVFFLPNAGTAVAQPIKIGQPDMQIQREALKRFIATKKFVPEGRYSGALNEDMRTNLEASVNALGNRLFAKIGPALASAEVLDEFKPTLAAFEAADSEDKDRLLGYLEDLMSIFKIKSSGGLLNTWRYGFDPTETVAVRNSKAVLAMTTEEKDLLVKLKNLKSTTAVEDLKLLLGVPSIMETGITTWFLNADQTSGISLMTGPKGQVLIWMAPGRFSYALEFGA